MTRVMSLPLVPFDIINIFSLIVSSLFYSLLIRKLKRSQSSKVVRGFPEPPPMELVQQAYLEEKRLARLRELKEKQGLIIQRRK